MVRPKDRALFYRKETARGTWSGSWLQRKYLIQRHLPLTQAEADDGDVPLVIDAHDPPLLVKARHMHRVVGLEPAAGLTQRRRGRRLTLHAGHLLLIFLALAVGLVLG